MGLVQLVGGSLFRSTGTPLAVAGEHGPGFIASILYALAPTAGAMMAARFVQGLAGGWAMMIGRAIMVYSVVFAGNAGAAAIPPCPWPS
jgi:DHA1 family bicyclomycin/chloramphenicol resistance-like MFS transporter